MTEQHWNLLYPFISTQNQRILQDKWLYNIKQIVFVWRQLFASSIIFFDNNKTY